MTTTYDSTSMVDGYCLDDVIKYVRGDRCRKITKYGIELSSFPNKVWDGRLITLNISLAADRPSQTATFSHSNS